MKKALSLFLALALVLPLCLAGFADDSGDDSTTQTTTETTTESTTETTTEATTEPPTETTTAPPTETTTAPTTETTTAPPEDTTATSPSWDTMPTEPTLVGLPTITKNPTSETVREGGYAEFVARADNCSGIIWHLQSPGGGTDVLAKDASNRFPGLIVTGLETERIGLNQIPMALNEWRVRAEFVGGSGNVWSEAAVIYVMNQELAAPTIQTQPKSASLNTGESASLQVSAVSSEQGTTLTYQWYKNTVNSNVGGKAILGATASTYTPTYTPGTVYYYCAVRSTNGTDLSAATKTACAAVTYPDAEEATTAATVTTTQPASAATLAPWGTGEETETLETIPLDSYPAPARSNTLLVVIVIVIIVIAVLGVLAAVLILKFYPGREEDYQVSTPRSRNTERTPRQQPKPQPPRQQSGFPEEDDEWDDLSDLDLSAYLDDEDDL